MMPESNVHHLNREPTPLYGLIGKSEKLNQVVAHAERAAKTKHSVLIEGETGTGKDRIARIIHSLSHNSSNGSKGRFVRVDCCGMPETLLESELFGHVAGAFTDARSEKTGLVEDAGAGTIFIDEVGDASPAIQSKLLRLCETKSFRKLGGTRDIDTNARIIAATNIDLRRAVREGRFRRDLYFRLNKLTVTIPPLRERDEDIPILATHFLEREDSGKGFTEQAIAVLRKHWWSGNVRELENVVIKAAASADKSAFVREEDVQPHLQDIDGPSSTFDLDEGPIPTYREIQKMYLAALLRRTYGNKRQASVLAKIKYTTFMDKLARYEIS